MQQERNQTAANHKVILNSIQDLQRLPLQLINSMRGRYPAGRPIKYGMTALFNNGAFTLIELLVVVLIIGILAAVAVPQYQKAVRKARIAEAKVILKQLTDAQDVYFLSHSERPDDNSPEGWNEVLDIELPIVSNKNWEFTIEDCDEVDTIGCSNYAVPKFEDTDYQIYFNSPNYQSTTNIAGKFLCTGNETICKGLGGVLSEDGITYILP